MQYLLRFLGFDRSYLFLNSFVYPIFGQYTPDLRPLAQDPRSPIVIHRNQIFDKAVVEGDVRLVIAVGRAAKESVATWIEAHGGARSRRLCTRRRWEPCRAGSGWWGCCTPAARHRGRRPRSRLTSCVRSGTSATGSRPTPAGFRPTPASPGSRGAVSVRLAGDPFPGLPVGHGPRLGRGGTSSNRSDDQRAIRLFSEAGKYNARGAHLRDPSSADGSDEGYADDPGDLPYEPPRAAPRRFDPGPPADIARLLAGGEPGSAWPGFAALGVTAHPSFGMGPIYRGRFRGLSLLVLADQGSDDDTFTGRALSGEAGQHFQGFLEAAGLTRRYLIIRTLPVDTLDLTPAKRLAFADHPLVQALHRELLRRLRERTPKHRLLAMGPGSPLRPVVPAGLDAPGLAAPGEPNFRASWQAVLTQLASRAYTRDLAKPTFTAPTARSQLPRIDLPDGALRWAGTSGDRAVRPVDTDTGKPSPDYLKLFLPAWAANLDPAPLTADEQLAAKQLT